ncbi:MAG: hypothetical protein EXX96DRAFT_492736, partial [Benjaminiella poitrasii]
SDFFAGKVYLSATRKQSKSLEIRDDKSQYTADEIIQSTVHNRKEVLLLETSSPFDNKNRIELNFNRHKDTFGGVTMLKIIVD